MAVPTIHKVTRWERIGEDEFNQPKFADPVELDLFWIDKERRVMDKHGQEFTSMARILTLDREFNLGDRAQFSDLANSNIDESYVVKQRSFVENGRQTSRLHQAFLGKGNG